MVKKVGILGFGIVGKSVLKFLRAKNSDLEISVWDQKELNDSEKELIKSLGAKLSDYALKDFFIYHDQVVVSPGIPLDKFAEYKNKYLCELDFFSDDFRQKTIAVTGTLGKTTIVNLLSELISLIDRNLKVAAAGNIGTGMLDLIYEPKVDLAVLQLSSFQLALNKKFSPDVAIVTNFYPNHLDWHSDVDDYFDSKCKIFENQKVGQYVILPASFLQNKRFLKKLETIKSDIYFVCDPFDCASKRCFAPTFAEASAVAKAMADRSAGRQGERRGERFYFFQEKDNLLFLGDKKIFDLNLLPDFSFRQNWLFVLAAMYLLGLDLSGVVLKKERAFLPHRLEHFATINGVDFYNDSKSTIMQATLAALKKLDQKNKPIILILGGLSKGVDRKPFVKDLASIKNLKKVFCFGCECKIFEDFENFKTLQENLNAVIKIAKKGDLVLFSPGGSSFDLFKNYAYRGEIFKQMVFQLNI